jgi:hypothetical protein
MTFFQTPSSLTYRLCGSAWEHESKASSFNLNIKSCRLKFNPVLTPRLIISIKTLNSAHPRRFYDTTNRQYHQRLQPRVSLMVQQLRKLADNLIRTADVYVSLRSEPRPLDGMALLGLGPSQRPFEDGPCLFRPFRPRPLHLLPPLRASGATTDWHLGGVVGAKPPRSSPIRPPPGGLEAGWEVLASP